MLMGYILYGIALILLIYIIVDLIRTGKFDTSDAIATLGIVVAVLLAIGTPLPNIFGRPTMTSQAELVFDENFDDGVANEITISNAEWGLVNVDKTDKALRVDTPNTDWGYVEFAEQTITNGTVEYSVNLINYDTSLNCSGCIAFHFRSTSRARYVFAILPDGRLSLYYQDADTNDEWVPLTKATSAYNLSPNTWHQVKITLIESDITVYFDGTKVLSAKDDRLKTGSMNLGIGANTIVQFDDLHILTQP